MPLPLAAKGPIAPPPVLGEPLQRLADAVQSWPGIIAATHWNLWRRNEVDGIDFYRGDDEIGHVHLDGELHLTVPSMVADHLTRIGLARRLPFGSDWVGLRIFSDDDLRDAEWLLRLAYDLLGGAPIDEVIARLPPAEATSPLPDPVVSPNGQQEAAREAGKQVVDLENTPRGNRHANA